MFEKTKDKSHKTKVNKGVKTQGRNGVMAKNLEP
jgi:hypothetical protein